MSAEESARETGAPKQLPREVAQMRSAAALSAHASPPSVRTACSPQDGTSRLGSASCAVMRVGT